MISIIGAVFVAATLGAILFRREWLPWILSAAVPFSATAGMTVAGQSIVVYPIVAIVLVASVAYRHTLSGILQADASSRAGLRSLVAFGAWAAAVTAIGPIIFSGIPVLDPRQGIDDGVKSPATLAFATSNIAQAGYVIIGIATVISISAIPGLSSRLPSAAFGVGTVASSARTLLPKSLQETLFDNSQNVSYTTGKFNGVERMRGIFSEPAALGAFSVAAATFFITAAAAARGPQRYLYLGFGIWSAVNAVLSFSGGAVVTGLIVLGIIIVHGTVVRIAGRQGISAGAIISSILLATVAFVVAPSVYYFVSLLLSDKANSSSYANRSAADTFSFHLNGETFGIGVGLGSNRPSSFFASLLSTTGVLGVAFFGIAVALVILGAMKVSAARPVAWALIALIVSKLTAGPDTSDPAMWFLLAVCANAVWGRPFGPVSTLERTQLVQKKNTGRTPSLSTGQAITT